MSKRPLGQISEELKISKGELENWLSHPVTMALQASLKEYMSTLTALSDEAISNALELSNEKLIKSIIYTEGCRFAADYIIEFYEFIYDFEGIRLPEKKPKKEQ